MAPMAKTEAAIAYVKDTLAQKNRNAVDAFPSGKTSCSQETLTRNLVQMDGLLDMALVVKSLTTFNDSQVSQQDFEAVFGDGAPKRKKNNRPQTAQPQKVDFNTEAIEGGDQNMPEQKNDFEMEELVGEADQMLPMQNKEESAA